MHVTIHAPSILLPHFACSLLSFSILPLLSQAVPISPSSTFHLRIPPRLLRPLAVALYYSFTGPLISPALCPVMCTCRCHCCDCCCDCCCLVLVPTTTVCSHMCVLSVINGSWFMQRI
ncbi:hypothetical protein C8Q72DRAFT_188210 [Fomitopsis betulina]|nr:hypothetical protein C8Q72DRAFT_188210 [Fomitopsis betulina]